jgi:hypothetical protein
MTEYQILRNDGNCIFVNVGCYYGTSPNDAIERMAKRGDVCDPHWAKNYIAIPYRYFKPRRIKNT